MGVQDQTNGLKPLGKPGYLVRGELAGEPRHVGTQPADGVVAKRPAGLRQPDTFASPVARVGSHVDEPVFLQTGQSVGHGRLRNLEGTGQGKRRLAFAHADEVVCSGVVHHIEPRKGRSPLVHIHIVRTHAHRMNYVIAVLRGQREPTARRHRRVPAELEARWFFGLRPQPFVIQEISLGGTFISAVSQPKEGFEFDMEIRLDSRSVPLRVPAQVAWLSHDVDRRGFGATFRLVDRSTAQRLANVVRMQGMRAGGM